MPKFVRTFIFLTALTISSLSFARRTGGESSGGGGVYLSHNGSITFWDFLLMDYVANPGQPLIETPALHSYGLDRLSSVLPTVFDEARNRIIAYRSVQPEMTKRLLVTLEKLPIFYLHRSLDLPSFALGEEGLRLAHARGLTNSPKLAAMYLSGYGVFIFDWASRLDFDGQIGLLVHEVLRHQQASLGFSHAQLEELTRSITFGQELPSWTIHRFGSHLLGGEIEKSLRKKIDALCEPQRMKRLARRSWYPREEFAHLCLEAQKDALDISELQKLTLPARARMDALEQVFKLPARNRRKGGARFESDRSDYLDLNFALAHLRYSLGTPAFASTAATLHTSLSTIQAQTSFSGELGEWIDSCNTGNTSRECPASVASRIRHVMKTIEDAATLLSKP